MSTQMHRTLPLILLGAGGHAKVVLSLVQANGGSVAGVCDPQLSRQGCATWQDIPILGDDSALKKFNPASCQLLNGIGQTVAKDLRSQIFEKFCNLGFLFPALIHPTSWVAPTSHLAPGVQVMAGAVVQPGCSIGANTIINTGACIDHDCSLGRHVHIAPGATICGDINIDDHVFIGSGATIIQGINIGKHSIVGAGGTLINHLNNYTKAIGTPAISKT